MNQQRLEGQTKDPESIKAALARDWDVVSWPDEKRQIGMSTSRNWLRAFGGMMDGW